MITLSYSKISSYLICPLKVKYRLEAQPAPMSADLVSGDCVDKALNAWAENKNWEEVYEARWKAYLAREVDDKSEWNGEITGQTRLEGLKDNGLYAIKNYLDDIERLQGTKPEIVQLELHRTISDIELIGIVDAMWGGTLIDWKYVKSLYYLGTLQPTIYAILNGGPTRFAYHCLLKRNVPEWKPKSVNITQSMINKTIEHIILPVSRAIEREDWHANTEHSLCKKEYCGYWGICPAHK